MVNAKLTTAFCVRSMVFDSKNGADLANDLFYKGTETIRKIIAVEYNNRIFCTNPLILVGDEDGTQ